MKLQDSLGKEKGSYILELVIVIMLGITSVMSAVASYQSGLHASKMSESYNNGISYTTEGNSMYVEAGQQLSSDTAIYMELISLEYDWMFSETGSDEEAKAEEKYNEFHSKFVSDILNEAIEWAHAEEEATGYYTSPFEYEPYLDAVYGEADEMYTRGKLMLVEGHKHNTHSDQMGQMVVYFALALFLLGICGTLKNNTLKLILVIFSVGVFIFAIVQMVNIEFMTDPSAEGLQQIETQISELRSLLPAE
ncbi:hypothetical protein LJC56_10010 [Christensenellaceae bacterium OttesenSCG-928-K19]|nr:hypothetical protein [Christensenellaceae bacterium OttesenSCG-928-K19]